MVWMYGTIRGTSVVMWMRIDTVSGNSVRHKTLAE